MEISKIKIPSGNSTVTLDIKDTVARESIPEMPDLSGGHDYVEIAGIKWATMNIGAESITDNGLYFQWGDTSGYTASQCGSDSGQKYFGWTDYKYGNGTDNPGAIGMTKYNSSDGKTVLELSDDAAQTNWGGAWRMPTTADFQALSNAVNTVWTADYQGSGVAGLVLTDKTDSSKVLFFPAAGSCYSGSVYGVGSLGNYWSSSVVSNNVQYAYRPYLINSYAKWQDHYYRCIGFPVRGVLDTSNLLHKVAVTGDYNDLENKPSSMPASDVSAWAKQSTKPSYTLDEINDGTNKTWDYIGDPMAIVAALNNLDVRLETACAIAGNAKYIAESSANGQATAAAINTLNKKISFLQDKSYTLDDISDGNSRQWDYIGDPLAIVAALNNLDVRLETACAIAGNAKYIAESAANGQTTAAAINMLNKKIMFLQNEIEKLKNQIS